VYRTARNKYGGNRTMLLRCAAAGALVTSALVPVTAATSSTASEPAQPGISSSRHVVHLPTPRPTDKKAEPKYDPHTVVVRFKSGTSATARTATLHARGAQAMKTIGRYVTVHTEGRNTDLLRELRGDPSVESASLAYLRYKASIPNDPAYQQGDQSYLNTLRLPDAWSRILNHDATSQVIAVLDTGVDTAHEDLVGRTVPGYNAVTPGGPYTDIDGHGTMVAGMAAANTNNGIGIAGAAWTGRVMPVRVFQVNPSTGQVEASDADIADGIDWAVAHGARIINLSLGSDAPSSQVLHDAIVNATAAGVLVVAAAGNTGLGEPHYPAAYPEVLAVGATDNAGGLVDFSTWGDWVDVVAPGFTDWGPILDPDPAPPLEHDWYASGAGTSFSSPLVAGIAAMVRTKFPSLTPAQVIDRIKTTARDDGPRGIDPYYGYGFVDASAAVGGPAGIEMLPVAVPSASDNDMPARAVPFTSTIGRALGPAGDVDWFRYTAQTSSNIRVTVTPPAFDENRAQNMDAAISVYNADLHLLRHADVSYVDPEFVDVSVPAGAVYIAVENANGALDTRSYTVTVATIANASSPPGEQLWVKDVSPHSFGLENSLTTTPAVTFQREIDTTSVTDSTVWLADGRTGQPVPGTTTFSAAGNQATINPTSALTDLAPYRIMVGAVKDTGGATNQTSFSTTFRADLLPTPATGFVATGHLQSATMHWTLPALNDFSQVIVRRSTGGAPPSDPNQGVGVYAGTGTSTTASGLGWGGTYAFRVWVKDRAGQISPYAEAKLTGTRISIAQSTSAVTYGGSVTYSGKITRADNGASVAGAAVQLYARQKGSATWRLLRTVTSTSTGTLSFAYKPSAGNDFQWRYNSGNTTLMGSGSSTVFTGVRTAVTAGLNRTSVPLGGTVAISGSVSPKHAGQLVYLQRYVGGGTWANVTTATLSSTSVYSFHPKPTTRATWTYRVVKPADIDHLTGVSPSRSVKVT
jgi:serine protease